MLDGLPPAVPVGERFLAQIRGHGANLTIRARLIASHPRPLVQVLGMGLERVPCQACGSPFAPDESLCFCEECADYPGTLADH